MLKHLQECVKIGIFFLCSTSNIFPFSFSLLFRCNVIWGRDSEKQKRQSSKLGDCLFLFSQKELFFCHYIIEGNACAKYIARIILL